MGNPKDKTKGFEKSGVYEINCKYRNQMYDCPSRRVIKTVYAKHLFSIKYAMSEKSSVTYHNLNSGYYVDKRQKLITITETCVEMR